MLPTAKNDAYKKWRDDWLNEITKTREVDREFRERILNDNVFTCERHFEAEHIEICKSKTLVVPCSCEFCSCLLYISVWICKNIPAEIKHILRLSRLMEYLTPEQDFN